MFYIKIYIKFFKIQKIFLKNQICCQFLLILFIEKIY